MEVSCSVTSLLVGETQITNQIRKSYKLAKECKSLKSILSRLIHSSLKQVKKFVIKQDYLMGHHQLVMHLLKKYVVLLTIFQKKKFLSLVLV